MKFFKYNLTNPLRAGQQVAGLIILFLFFAFLTPSALASLSLARSDLAQSAAPYPPGASVRTRLQVPDSMRNGILANDRYLNLPPNFSISVVARLSGARFMAVAPNGDLLVSQPGSGKVSLVREVPGSDPQVYDFVTGLRSPHDMVFHTIGSTSYLYISESHQIDRFVYTSGATSAGAREIVVKGLPDASTPELGGKYGHELKNIALDSNNKLYVSIGSTCNACLSDTTSNPRRGAIYQYDADGSNGRLFAQGLRNAEGLAFVPGTNDLWVVVNNRDNIAVPDPASSAYGKVVQSYVDDHPPEEFTRVRDGGNYGWPFCNPNQSGPTGYDNMPFDRDVEFNADGHVNCDAMDRINKGIQAHSAPLGLTFLQNTTFAAPYRQGVLAALHGSWNRANPTGYKVIYFPWNSAVNAPGGQVDLVTGWLNEATGEAWGRPVDIAVNARGDLLISDDYSGTVYKMTYTSPAGSGPGQNFTLAHPAFDRLWQRSDRQVFDHQVARTYLWGPQPNSAGLQEEYADSPGGKRLVQYFDKSRMEVNNPNGDQSSPYFVTNGLLARELINGQMQVGDQKFQPREPAVIGVAGDIDDTSGPTYAALQKWQAAVGQQSGLVTTAFDRSGNSRDGSADFARYNIRPVYFVPETGHNVAAPFWDFLNQSGPLLSPTGLSVQGRLFEPLFYATGFPVTEAFWAKVKVGGQVKDVLVQAFERRVLTYTPSNPAGFQVEMGNVGQHYYLWRYGNSQP
ncbi:MAG TPA: hypothetical protein VH186_26850 [Chloroflexia bacterium]|nr:hypothetical protein [Chloroflexia bacterium]